MILIRSEVRYAAKVERRPVTSNKKAPPPVEGLPEPADAKRRKHLLATKQTEFHLGEWIALTCPSCKRSGKKSKFPYRVAKGPRPKFCESHGEPPRYISPKAK